MARYRYLFFVCNNRRGDDSPKGCCTQKKSAAVLDRMKGWVHSQGLRGKVRVVESGCLNFCARGVTVAAFSGDEASEVWYTGVSPEDCEALLKSHVGEERPYLARLEEI